MNTILQRDFEEILSHVNKDKLYQSKWLITGATGVIGAYFVAFLSWLNEYGSSSEMNISIVHRSDNYKSHPILKDLYEKDYITWIKADLSDEFTIENLDSYHYILHAASNAAPKAYLNDPIGTINVNVKATEYLLRQVKESSALKSFVYVSSGEIYGDPKQVPTPEQYKGKTDHLSTRSCYVESKRFAEVICMNYFWQYALPVKIIRPIHVFGPGFKTNDGRVWADFMHQVLKDQNIMIQSDGKAQRGFCYIASAMTQIFRVIQLGRKGEVYNIGDERLTSIKELADLVSTVGKNYFGKSSSVQIQDQLEKHHRGSPSISCPSIEKVELLDTILKIDIEEGIRRTMEWMLLQQGELT